MFFDIPHTGSIHLIVILGHRMVVTCSGNSEKE